MRRGGRGRPRRRAGATAFLACALALPLSLAGCGAGRDARPVASGTSPAGAVTAGTGSGGEGSTGGAAASAEPSSGGGGAASFAVTGPGPLDGPLVRPDVLVTSTRSIPASVRSAVDRVTGVTATEPLSLSSLSANGRTIAIAAVDPARFRRWTPVQSAQAQEVWDRVAGGEVAVDPSLPRRLEDPKGYLRLGATEDAPDVHIGAYAPLVRQVSAVVNEKRGAQLGVPAHNALLVSTGDLTPSKVTGAIRRVLGPDTTLQTLALEFNVDVLQTAVLTGGSVTSRVGTFSYTPHADGTVTPERSWVRAYIRTEEVPILGSVTCNKGMLPQLRAALTEVVRQGLADRIHPGEYAGCYYPRFIANDPAKGLSLHSWGVAVDLNVPGNQRGTAGQMDRRVVAIFKKWGFAWGGDWRYTDPMHFEMAKVVGVG